MYRNFFALSILIALISCLTDVSCQRERCLGVHNYCSGQFGDMKAICKDGYCYCTGQDYDYNTCLRKLVCFDLNKLAATIYIYICITYYICTVH